MLQQPDNEVWQFADLRYVMPVHVPPMFKLPAAIQRLRELVLQPEGFDRGTSRPKRIYLSRNDTKTRRIANEADLSILLSEFGFQTVCVSGLRLSEQAHLFAEAEAIIGVKGAALANIIFCRAPCSVMVLSPADFPDPFFWDIAGQLGLRYAELFGPVTTSFQDSRNDFIVDLVAVARMLGAVLESGASGGG